MIKFTVKRSEWLRGEGQYASKLLRGSDCKKCCLGFLALSLGANEEDIKGLAAPVSAEVLRLNIPWPEEFFVASQSGRKLHSHACAALMHINDDESSSDKDKEALLTKHLEKIGIKVTFVD